jgi:hypothetical protein
MMTLVEELDRLLYDALKSDPLIPLVEAFEKGEFEVPDDATTEDLIAFMVPGFKLCFRLFSAQRECILRLASEIDNLRAS